MSTWPNPRSAKTMKTRGRPSIVIAIAGLLALAAACAENGVAPLDPAQEKLLFVRTTGDAPALGWQEQTRDMFRMNADGTGVENLTKAPAGRYGSLSLSPDGRRVAFNSDRSGCIALWTMGVDGFNPVQLTGLRPFSEERCNYTPRWSRDGKRIAFTTTREQNWAVYVMNPDGTNLVNVSAGVEKERGYNFPTGWSPDGRVVFNHQSQPTESTVSWRTYVVNADGTGLRPLFDRAGDYAPHWSPDGSKIAFLSNRDGTDKLYVMNADGSGLRKLSNLPGHDLLPLGWASLVNDVSPWSPDGTRIAFGNANGLVSTLHVVNADGSGLHQLTTPAFTRDFGQLPFYGWSPTGTRIAFGSNATGSDEIYLINADGTGLVNVTNTPTLHETDAVWLPR